MELMFDWKQDRTQTVSDAIKDHAEAAFKGQKDHPLTTITTEAGESIVVVYVNTWKLQYYLKEHGHVATVRNLTPIMEEKS